MRVDHDILDLATGIDVAEAAHQLFGDLAGLRGTVHVTAVWAASADNLVTLAINEHTPRCHHDFFALNLVRASADAIITTGKILRLEPTLEHRLAGPGDHPQALTEFRRQVLGKTTPPVTLVLTSGSELDLDHPIFHAWTRPLVYTSLDGQWKLESRAADHGVEVVGVAEPSIHHAVDLLRREFGAATIAIEAGPSVSRQLYEPIAVDHLLMSTYRASRLPAAAEGDLFLTVSDLAQRFRRRGEPCTVRTDDGLWDFQHFSR